MPARVLHPPTKGSAAARALWILVVAACVEPACAAGEPPPGAPRALIESALEDAAQRAQVPRAHIEVLSAEAVTWSDGSMGCPQPGMMYTQALVPGYRIVLRAGQTLVAYHAGRNGPARFCPADRAQPPVASDRT